MSTRGREVPWGYVALAGALLLAVGLFVVQSGMLSGDDDDGDGQRRTPVAAAATATVATADAAGGEGLPPTATTVVEVAAASPEVVASHPACEVNAQLAGAPSGLQVNDPMFSVWFGEPGSALAVAPVALAGINHDLPDTGQYWFAEGPLPVLWFGSEAPLAITARLLDGGGATVAFDGSEVVFRDALTQGMEMTFPEPGCWEITATTVSAEAGAGGGSATADASGTASGSPSATEGASATDTASGTARAGEAGEVLETTFAVQVAPFAERPDAALAISNATAAPYVAPEACGDPGWSGPSDPLGVLWAAWWIEEPTGLDGEELALGTDAPVFWNNIESHFIVRAFNDDPTRIFRVDAMSSVDGSTLSAPTYQSEPGQASGTLFFGHPGCWTVYVRDAGETLMSVDVFVYPIDCRRESGVVPVPDGCTVLGE